MLVWALRGFTCRERNLGNCTSISLEVESPSSLKLSDSGQTPVSSIPITILLPVLALLTCWRSPWRPMASLNGVVSFHWEKNYYHNFKHILSLTQRIWYSSSSLLFFFYPRSKKPFAFVRGRGAVDYRGRGCFHLDLQQQRGSFFIRKLWGPSKHGSGVN